MSQVLSDIWFDALVGETIVSIYVGNNLIHGDVMPSMIRTIVTKSGRTFVLSTKQSGEPRLREVINQ